MEFLEATYPLSIITVCFNEARRIELTCRSIVQQTFQDFDWIVIDGASTDGTLAILRQYASRMNVLISEKDRGIYHAMNKGILQAKGHYLLFLNGGDYLYESETLARIFAAGKMLERDVYYGDVLSERVDELKFRSFDFTDYYAMFTQRSLPHQATFIKRALFETYGLYDESFTIAADMEFFLRVFIGNQRQNSLEHVPFIISVYENVEGISSRNIAARDAQHLLVKRKYYPASYLLYSQARQWYKRRKSRWLPPIKNAIKQIILRKTPCRK